jgi:hypothetical protein
MKPIFSEFIFAYLLVERQNKVVFGTDPNRIALLGKPPAVKHSFPSKSQ